MNNSLTSTRHTLDCNRISPDKFEHLIFWLVEDSGDYENVEYFGGPGDKGRDVIGYNFDNESDFYQCKRYQSISFSILKVELDLIKINIEQGKIKSPQRIYIVTSNEVSPQTKDKLKKYSKSINLCTPNFWGAVILDKKIKNNPKVLANFFGISEQIETVLPQVDVEGLICYGTQEYNFEAVNHGESTAIDCTWYLKGFNFNHKGTPDFFSLKPEENKNLIINLPGDFMKQKPIKELRLHFEYRDNKNNKLYSEKLLNVEMVSDQSFYRISAYSGDFVPPKTLIKFKIENMESLDSTGFNYGQLITYSYSGEVRCLEIRISGTLHSIWKLKDDEFIFAFKELAERKITQMILANNFEDKLILTTDTFPVKGDGFDAYKNLRDSIL